MDLKWSPEMYAKGIAFKWFLFVSVCRNKGNANPHLGPLWLAGLGKGVKPMGILIFSVHSCVCGDMNIFLHFNEEMIVAENISVAVCL